MPGGRLCLWRRVGQQLRRPGTVWCRSVLVHHVLLGRLTFPGPFPQPIFLRLPALVVPVVVCFRWGMWWGCWRRCRSRLMVRG